MDSKTEKNQRRRPGKTLITSKLMDLIRDIINDNGLEFVVTPVVRSKHKRHKSDTEFYEKTDWSGCAWGCCAFSTIGERERWWHCNIRPPEDDHDFFHVDIKVTDNRSGLYLRISRPDGKVLVHSSVDCKNTAHYIENCLRLDIKHAIMETVGVLDQIAWGIDASSTKNATDESDQETPRYPQ